MDVLTIRPLDLEARRQKGERVEMIDVRTPVEYREVHCPLARNVPLAGLDPAAVMGGRAGAVGEPLYVICRTGGRGQQACEKFRAAGYANVVNVEGGTLAWAASGLPVNRGKAGVSLERQVRIAAGSLVLTGVALAAVVHPYLLGLSAFVGAGLVFSGITDTCGMGLVLARMPWNRASTPACETAANPS
ncbi:rhodanese-like domain-containing protein [Limnoglobus roseus]|uniref:Rhodanese-like domain-containing protein n=1 Tax=Limnoglobus roseus TaxID=2598579 RepID=A0A5C1AAQ1_9BACT|nr:rhodanese-like domain-containing protein [Limnoglobus roseus]QEL15645.1 rhodanese-like domain-containing protein [Limnoglobus roseus]